VKVVEVIVFVTVTIVLPVVVVGGPVDVVKEVDVVREVVEVMSGGGFVNEQPPPPFGPPSVCGHDDEGNAYAIGVVYTVYFIVRVAPARA
jgi:hypothetical protein